MTYLHDVIARLALFGLDGASLGDLPLPGIGSVTVTRGRWKSDNVYVGFTSFTTARITQRASVSKRTAETISAARTSRFASDDYEVKQVWVTSKDGTKVPMFLFRKKGAPTDGASPTAALRVRRVRRHREAGLLGLCGLVRGAGRHLRARQYSRRLGVR